MPRPFRFLADARAIASLDELRQTVRRAESIGIDTLVVPDHLIPQLSPIPALTAIAVLSDRLRLSAFVHNNDLRHPAVLAQDLASLDVLSGGRLDVAIGAGWNRAEYDAVGLPFDRTPVRQARLAEAIAVLKGCFAHGPFSFSGEHYTITDHDAHPKPIQRPHPPLLIGGGGRRTLTLAAREANIVGLAPRILPVGAPDPGSISVEGTREKIAWVRAAAGERSGELELNVYPSTVPVQITDDPLGALAEPAARLSGRTGVTVTPQELLDSPHVYVNTVDGFVEKFTRLRDELGITSIHGRGGRRARPGGGAPGRDLNAWIVPRQWLRAGSGHAVGSAKGGPDGPALDHHHRARRPRTARLLRLQPAPRPVGRPTRPGHAR